MARKCKRNANAYLRPVIKWEARRFTARERYIEKLMDEWRLASFL